MNSKIIAKRKALILNEEGKLLVFKNESTWSYPSINSKNGEIIAILGEDYLDNYEYLTKTKQEKVRYKIENGHAKKEITLKKHQYYAMMHSLTPEEIIALMNISKKKGMYPDFLSLEELRLFYEYRYYTKRVLVPVVEQGMEPIFVLEEKMGKERKLRRDVTYVRN